jgi:hypothetical protein
MRNKETTMKETTMKTIATVIKPVSEMTLIEPKRSTKWIDKYVIYEVVSDEDSFGYFKVQEPSCIGGRIHFIHKNNMKKVRNSY